MGLWSSDIRRPITVTAVATVLGGCPHHHKRTGPGGHCLGLVGQTLARLYSAMQIRQHGSVAVLNTGSAKEWHLLYCLHFFTANAQLSIVANHIPGRLNMGADAILLTCPFCPTVCNPASGNTPSTGRYACTLPPRLDLAQLEADL